MPDQGLPGLEIRPAGPEQSERIPPLMRSTHPVLYDEQFQSDAELQARVARALWESEDSLESHTCAHGAYLDGVLVGFEIGGDTENASAREKVDDRIFKELMTSEQHAFFEDNWRNRWSYCFPRFPEGTYYVGDLAVSEDCHGKGVGRALLQAAFDRAKAIGYRDVQLDLYASNPAYHFYLAMGMEKLSETYVPILENTSTPLHYRMIKRLQD